MTKTMVTIAGAIWMAVAGATVVNAQQPAVLDAYFEPKSDSLEGVPANIAVVQPTHFPDQAGKIKHIHKNDKLTRTVGRNVTFRDLIAEAYDCEPGCVVLPPDAPTGGFDFLVTVSPGTRSRLRNAIETELGYRAKSEMLDTKVMVLQVTDPTLPGMTISTASDDDVSYRDGRLYFMRQPISMVVKGLEEGLALPVVDKTGLTNNYDFSLTWDDRTTRRMRDGAFTFDGTQKVLNGWGLELKPDTARMEMFTVTKSR
jgi:uncharacterized protein (TIGR03435 family)